MEARKLKKIIIKEEIFALTGDTFEAIILGQLIYWQERVSDFDKFIKEERERAECHHIPFQIEETNGWIYKKASELKEECMLTVSEQTIRKYLQNLIKKGIISYRQNPSYKWDKTFQYRVNINYIIEQIKILGYDGLSGWNHRTSEFKASEDNFGDSEVRNGDSYLKNGGAIPYTTYRDYNTDTTYKKEDTNVSSKDDENWRTSFAIYKSLVDEAKLRLINDRDYQAYIESYYPNADYVKSINKMVEGFWGIEDGWEHCKKKRKAKNINMYAAIKKNLDNRNRIVYNPISTFTSKKSYNPKNEESKPSVPLHPELTYVDNDGTLSDGTFMKNGYRYYFSNRQGESFSVPPGEEPKPSGDNWEYAYGTGWYENIE